MGQASTIENAETVEVSHTAASSLEREREARMAAYLAEPRELPKSCVDENGRLIPMSEDESKARWDRFLVELAEIGPDDDDPAISWEQFKREMNDERRREGARLLYLEP